MAVRRIAFSLVWLCQTVWNNGFRNTVGWRRCRKSQARSPLLPSGLPGVRGTSGERAGAEQAWPAPAPRLGSLRGQHEAGGGCARGETRGEGEKVPFADAAVLSCLWNCGQRTSLVSRHRNGSRSPRPPCCRSRLCDSSNQTSLSSNALAQNWDLFFAASTLFQHCDWENLKCVETEQCWFPRAALALEKV